MSKNALLVSFKADTLSTVSRSTVKKMVKLTGAGNETQLIHMALRAYAALVLPAYPADDGLPTQAQMDAIGRITPQDIETTTLATLF
ncbi:MAG: hypothetical protein ACTS9Y_00555 [Methylophilus sp.]|uniref:hypothetical protein n=1 Tax=Methylophilus sp. TaxID=29541 RepID=UPI003F9EC57D